MTAALEGGEWSAARPGRTLPPGKEPVPILQEAGWAPGPVWRAGKSRPHRDSIPDRPAPSSAAIPTQLPGPQTYTLTYPFPKGKLLLDRDGRTDYVKVKVTLEQATKAQRGSRGI